MAKREKKQSKYYEFKECEVCGKSPAIPRFWNGKNMCSECARESFKKYLAAVAAGATIWLIMLLVIG